MVFLSRNRLKRKLRPVKGKDLLPAAAKKIQHNSIRKMPLQKEHFNLSTSWCAYRLIPIEVAQQRCRRYGTDQGIDQCKWIC